MLRRRLLQGTAQPQLCHCRTVVATRVSSRVVASTSRATRTNVQPGHQLWWAPRVSDHCSKLARSARPRWLSIDGGSSRSKAPIGTSGEDEERDGTETKKKSGWRDMDPTLVKHGTLYCPLLCQVRHTKTLHGLPARSHDA